MSLPERKGRAPSGKRGRIEQPTHLPCSHSCSTAFIAPPPSGCFGLPACWERSPPPSVCCDRANLATALLLLG
eukprot:393835-Prymnesium_polylepis.1